MRPAADGLRAAGFTDVHTSPFDWSYGFSDEEALWAFVFGPGVFGRQFAVLGEGDREKVRAAVVASMDPYRQAGDDYRIPHTCRLYWGSSRAGGHR